MTWMVADMAWTLAGVAAVARRIDPGLSPVGRTQWFSTLGSQTDSAGT